MAEGEVKIPNFPLQEVLKQHRRNRALFRGNVDDKWNELEGDLERAVEECFPGVLSWQHLLFNDFSRRSDIVPDPVMKAYLACNTYAWSTYTKRYPLR